MPRRRRRGKWSCRERDGKVRCVPIDERLKSRLGSYTRNDSFFGNSNYRIKVDPQTEYTDWRRYSYERHFSTHDWLAYIPLKTITETPELNATWDRLEPNF